MNKVNHALRLSCWIWLVLSAGCQSYDRSANLWLVNRTNHLVYYWLSCDSAYPDMQMNHSYKLKAHESVQPYLLYGPEGNGPNKNSWINAINRADDSALHIFFYYIDYKEHGDRRDSVFKMIIKRYDLRVDSLIRLGWKVEYPL
ncbi:MAG TPA: hypothetical protein VFE32_06090 [Puia sp.]|jgi:hypothetical protein|nr:hypothetical protein [Puia sp.]